MVAAGLGARPHPRRGRDPGGARRPGGGDRESGQLVHVDPRRGEGVGGGAGGLPGRLHELHVCRWRPEQENGDPHQRRADRRGAPGADLHRAGGMRPRTGMRHLTWAPTVAGGIIQQYQTGGEAEYPRGLCDAVGQAIRERRAAGTARSSRIAFTEVFAGPRAILSARVAWHVVAGMVSSSSSSTSPSS